MAFGLLWAATVLGCAATVAVDGDKSVIDDALTVGTLEIPGLGATEPWSHEQVSCSDSAEGHCASHRAHEYLLEGGLVGQIHITPTEGLDPSLEIDLPWLGESMNGRHRFAPELRLEETGFLTVPIIFPADSASDGERRLRVTSAGSGDEPLSSYRIEAVPVEGWESITGSLRTTDLARLDDRDRAFDGDPTTHSTIEFWGDETTFAVIPWHFGVPTSIRVVMDDHVSCVRATVEPARDMNEAQKSRINDWQPHVETGSGTQTLVMGMAPGPIERVYFTCTTPDWVNGDLNIYEVTIDSISSHAYDRMVDLRYVQEETQVL